MPQPTKVEIRMFQVGFGDCFLLSFVYSEKDRRHVLIDFGSTKLPESRRKKSPYSMAAVAKEIAALCPKGLTAVVATHRHADHISGFGGKTGAIIKALKPKVVLQPWTEHPDAAKDPRPAVKGSNRSRKGFVAGLAAMDGLARSIRKLALNPPAWMGPQLAEQLRFIGEDNIKNKPAVKNLIAMGKAAGAKRVFARHGDKSGLEKHLPGVTIHVLGPPDLTQTESILSMTDEDKDEFWHLIGGTAALASKAVPTTGGSTASRTPLSRMPAEARWFRDRLDNMRGQQLLEIVRILDDQMNNTSLILLFEVCGKKLLFPGDAQLENWNYALSGAPDHKKTRALLADVDVYKVGHHGSLNATPRKVLWHGFKKRKKASAIRLSALLSTLPGKHGTAKNDTEVPRKTLVEALGSDCKLFTTNGMDPDLRCETLVVDRKGVTRLPPATD